MTRLESLGRYLAERLAPRRIAAQFPARIDGKFLLTSALAGAGVFAALSLFSWLRGAPPVPPVEAYRGLWATFIFHRAWVELKIFLAMILIGGLAGAAFRLAWEMAGVVDARIAPEKWRPRQRAGAIAAAVLLLHFYFIWKGLHSHPALYQGALPGFLGGLPRLGFYTPALLIALYGGILKIVLLLAPIYAAGHLFRWIVSLPAQKRTGYFVISGGGVVFLIGLAWVLRAGRPSNAGPNLILFVAPGLRSDRLALAEKASPALYKMAAHGKFYPETVPSLAEDAPALASLLTGQSALVHGVRHSFPSNDILSREDESWLWSLSRAGYQTTVMADGAGSILARLPLPGRRRVPAPDIFSEDEARIVASRLHFLPYISSKRGGLFFANLRGLPVLADTEGLSRDVHDQLDSLRFQKKFCLVIYTTTLEGPCYLSSRSAVAFLKKRGIAWPGSSWNDAESLAQRVALYDANLAAFDNLVRRTSDDVKSWNLKDKTLVAVWSPYGTPLSGSGAALSFEDAAVWKAPLILQVPFSKRNAKWSKGPVRPQDVAPTLLDILDAPPGAMEGWALGQGERVGLEPEELAAYAEGPIFDKQILPLSAPPPIYALEKDASGRLHWRLDAVSEDRGLVWKKRMIQVESKRLIYTPTRQGAEFQMFDLAVDPDQKDNLAVKPAATASLEAMKDLFFRVLSREEGWRPQNDLWIPEAFLREKLEAS